MLDGFYKVEFSVNGASGRSVMYARDGILLGGGSAFAHIGTYEDVGDHIYAELVTRRHNNDPRYDSLLGTDDATLKARGRADADGKTFRFQGGSEQLPGAIFRSVMTQLEEEISPPGEVGQDGIVNGLYSIHIRTLDGIEGGNTGVMLFHNGRILGGDGFFYYLGSYASANGRWKAEILNQEHTPAKREVPLFGGHDIGIGISGTCNNEGAEAEAVALVGTRSIRCKAVLKLMRRA
ncbi:MAG TPA: GrlR family regulatory protein [Beijerinckiaceae bacterium]|nr:GrlR family regulatory protein [Beijerinckiaceae bacterium]